VTLTASRKNNQTSPGIAVLHWCSVTTCQ
jgi:hypothetical protein